jgi:rhamnosyltransferase subunit B
MQAGFPLYDEAGTKPASSAVIDFVQSGAPPLVFMPGTAQRETADFFRAAVQACEQLGRRGLLLGAVPDDLARSLPASVHAAAYAPFDWLLPYAGALVHHGGIGSCAQALRAAVPQLIVPSGYDQFDNAMRIERLGVGRVLRGGVQGLARMPAQLKKLVRDESVRQACATRAPMTRPDAARSAIVTLAARLAP